ncbi:MAG TPA: adenylate/guanylate cyclase domain-containing protein [bacterium]|nr:adenylate/guanylate cyclase domain-containing protein [bacterium]
MSTRTLAIMFTDIKGFTARTSGESRAELVHLLDEHDQLLRPVFAHFHGTVVKTIGDAFLVWFESPTDAVVCGVTIQEVLRQHNAAASEHDRIDVRISINIGDVELRPDGTGNTDVFGEAVNLAARLEGITEAGEVWFTEAVYLTMNRHETPTAEVGERTFKGIPHPVRVYKVLFDPKSDQLQRIAAGVKVVDGKPVIGNLPTAASAAAAAGGTAARGGGRVGVTPVYVATALAIVGMIVVTPSFVARHKQARALNEARAAIDHGDADAAVEIVDRALAGGRTNDELAAVGVRAEEMRLDRKSQEAGAEEALKFAEDEIARRPWAASMRGRIPQIETIIAARHVAEDGSREPELTRIFEKYPKDSTVPWLAAEIVQGVGMPQYVLPWYEMALERGHAPDPAARELCEQTFLDFSPAARWTEICLRLEKKYYAKDRTLWAEKHFASDSANEFLAAWEIFRDEKRPEAADPTATDLHDLLRGSNDESLRARLLATRDPDARKRAHALLSSAIAHGTFETSTESDAAKKLLDELDKGR